jgi:hypothetical protein
VKTAYWKFSVVTGFEDVQGEITADTTWVNTKAYRLSGLVFVKNNATLTIEPGTVVIGQPGAQPPSALIITRNAKIMADGTRSRPIIFTSSQPIGQRRPGDWGGLVLLGKAPSNWPGGEGFIEGIAESEDSTYGGNDPTHNCGTLRFVRIEFAGSELAPNNEINAFTFGGCGTDTVADYLEVKYGFDDAFEWFAGTMNARHLVGLYTRDDYIDGQIGWTGNVQFALLAPNREYQGNRGIEMDNNETGFDLLPRSHPNFYNMTFVGAGDAFDVGVDEGNGVAGAWLRRGAGGSLNNLIFYNWVANGIEVRDGATQQSITAGELTADGILLWDNGKFVSKANTLDGQTTGNSIAWLSGTQGEANNVLVADPMLRRPFEYSDPDYRPRTGSPVFRANWVQPPDDSGLDQSANYIGAFGSEDWTEEWCSFHQEDDLLP